MERKYQTPRIHALARHRQIVHAAGGEERRALLFPSRSTLQLTRLFWSSQQADSGTDETGSTHSEGHASNLNDEENGSQADLDADMQDLDEEGRDGQFEDDDDEDLDDMEDGLENSEL